MRRILWIFVALASECAGCSCLFRSAKEAWRETPIIFIGRLDRVETTRHPGRKWGFTHSSTPAYDTHKAWIRVDESFKGAKAGDFFTYGEDEGNCSFVFQDKDTQGQWLFYAWPTPGSQMVHLGCSRTSRLPNAAADLLFLRALPNSGRKNRLSGTVSRLQDLDIGMFDRTATVGGIRITVLGESTTREIRTDGNGVFLNLRNWFQETTVFNWRCQPLI